MLVLHVFYRNISLNLAFLKLTVMMSKSIKNVKNKHSMGLMGRMVTNNKIGMEGVGVKFII